MPWSPPFARPSEVAEPTRHTRQDVVERTQREFQRLDDLVKRLDAADWRRRMPRPETKDQWTVKDALAHVVHWKEHTAHVIRGEKRPPELRGLEVGAINRIVYERWRNRRPADVLAWHRENTVRRGRATLPVTPAGIESGTSKPR